MQYLIMCRTLTFAQKSSKLLEKYAIDSIVVKAPQKLTGGGCGYAVNVPRKGEEAIVIMKRNNMISGKIYRVQNGEYIEIR